MARTEAKGAPSTVLTWARVTGGDNGEYVLRTEGLVTTAIIATWPATERDRGKEWTAEVLDLAQADCDARESVGTYALVWVVDDRDRASFLIRRLPDVADVDIRAAKIHDVASVLDLLARQQEQLGRQLAAREKHIEGLVKQVVQQSSAQAVGFAGIVDTLVSRVRTLEGQRSEALEMERAGLEVLKEDPLSEEKARQLAKLGTLAEGVALKLLSGDSST